MITNPTFGVVAMAVKKQSGKLRGTFHHMLAMVWALLGVEIEDVAFVIRKLGYVAEHLAVGKCSGKYSTHVESLFALCLSGRCREIVECAYYRTVAEENFRGFRNLVSDFELVCSTVC